MDQISIPSGASSLVCGHFLRRQWINKSRPIIHHYTQKHPPADAQNLSRENREIRFGKIENRRKTDESRPVVQLYPPSTHLAVLKICARKPPDQIWKPHAHLDLQILSPKTRRSFEKPPPSFTLPPPTYLDLLNRLRVRNRPGLCIIFKRWRADKRCRKQFSPAFCFNIINLNLSGYKQLQLLIDSEVNMWIICSEKQ